MDGLHPACTGKQAYPSYSLAAHRIKKQKKIKPTKGTGKGCRLEIYRCRFCHSWHIGNGGSRR